MLKLKIINKPKMLKIKCNFKFPEVVLANLQDKETTPTKELQFVVADENYDGLSKVIVNPIPDEYIIPSGELEIIQNGTYDVSSKASTKVNVPMPTGTIDITENGLHNVKDKEFANVSVPEKALGTKTITTNGIYKASDDNLDGYSEVEVATSGVDINDYYDLKQKINATFIKYIKQIPMIDTSDYTSISQMFQNLSSLTAIQQLNTSKVKDMSYAFYYCSSLTTIGELDASKVINLRATFLFCNSLTTIGGFTNLGQAYSTTASANYFDYALNLSGSNNFTHDSLMNVINNLYDIATKGCNPQQLVLGSSNISKLSAEELQICTNKGWSIS